MAKPKTGTKEVNCPRCQEPIAASTDAGPFRDSAGPGVSRCRRCALTVLEGKRLSSEVGPGGLPVARFRVARSVDTVTTRCPRCPRALRSVTFEDEGELVTVEECSACRLFLLDDGELPPLRRFLARAVEETGARRSPRRWVPRSARTRPSNDDMLAVQLLAKLLREFDGRG